MAKLVNIVEIDLASMNPSCSLSFALLSSISPLTSLTDVHRRHDVASQVGVFCQEGVLVQESRTKWIGGVNDGAVPIAACVRGFEFDVLKNGMHILNIFFSISCGGLRTVSEAGYVVTCYTSIEIDEQSRCYEAMGE